MPWPADVDHAALVEAVDQLSQLGSTSVDQTSSQYFGGEVCPYKHMSRYANSPSFPPQAVTATDDTVANVVFAFKGQPATGDQATQLILRNLLGGDGSALKWSSDATASTVGKAVGKAVTGPFQASAFAATYSDSGLVGVHLAMTNSDVKPAVTAAAEVRGMAQRVA